ncbi:head GIN domain-containing protein [Fulvivirgaceae bacterium BMA12]|uniref:Head GIN domain-containing protein n=1 Tax=Agaribacillus aureus TaxID=3051825 RepID=A0ABT8L2F2_9BACT|nr:head GIN domain-containing protein [Fulvivirgaceae bacterium BMA12]
MKNFNILFSILLATLGTLVFSPIQAQKTINVAPFTGVKLGLPVDLYIRQGTPQKVVVEASGEVTSRIHTKILHGNLYIIKGENDSGWWEKQQSKSEKIKIYITAPNIKNLAVSGSGSILSENTLRGDNLKIDVSGSGSVKVAVAVGHVEGKVSGSSTMGLKGSAQNTKFRVSGSANLNAERLAADNCQVELSGSGNCRIQVSNNLMSRISGSGKVYYKGNPKKIINNASGTGSLKKIS